MTVFLLPVFKGVHTISFTVIILCTISSTDGAGIVLTHCYYRKMVVADRKSKIMTLFLLTVILIVCNPLYNAARLAANFNRFTCICSSKWQPVRTQRFLAPSAPLLTLPLP